MPELPEVETVKESLKLRLSNKKIIRARVLWDNIIAYPNKDEFIKEIASESIDYDYSDMEINNGITVDDIFNQDYDVDD